MKRKRHELWGFGPAGWVGAVVLLVLLIPVSLGIDLRDHLLVLITHVLGIDATYFVVARVLPFNWMALNSPQLNLISLMLCLPAVFLAWKHSRSWWSVALLVLCAFSAQATAEFYSFVWPHIVGPTSFDYMFTVLIVIQTLIALIGAGCVYGMTRTWAYATIWGAAAVLGVLQFCVWDHIIFSWKGASLTVLSLLFHVVTAGSLYFWAVRLRLSKQDLTCCPDCGYELRGVPGPVCPECGGACRVSIDG